MIRVIQRKEEIKQDLFVLHSLSVMKTRFFFIYFVSKRNLRLKFISIMNNYLYVPCFLIISVAVVVAFFCCWAPFNAQRLMTSFIEPNDWTEQLIDIQGKLWYISGT